MHGLAGVLGGEEEGESAGALLIDGRPAAEARGRAGLVLQDPDAQVILARVGDDVAFGCENLGVPREEIWPRVRGALDAVGLDVPLDRQTKALSGGQKQRLALAGVMAMRPGLVLLDEPTANLDPEGVRDVRDAVGRVVAESGATLVVIEHRVSVWLPVVTRVIVLGRGRGGRRRPARRRARPRGPGARRRGRLGARHPARAPRPAPRRSRARCCCTARTSPSRGCAACPSPRSPALDVRAGSVLAVTGPNGAGKSTLGLTLAGLLPPHAGELTAAPALAGGAGATPIRWTSKQLLTRIGMVFQEPEHQLLGRTVREELLVGPRALGLGDAETSARVDDLLERLRLAPLAEANPYTLSGGEKRRLTVAAALATRPRVLVLDEPTFGQDARTWAELVAMLAGLRDSGSAIVAITHDEDVRRRAARRAAGARPRPHGTGRCGMTLLEARARTGVVARINPVAKLGASALIAIPLVLTLDWVSAAVALLLECLLFPFAGIGWREFWARTWPVWVAAPLTALTIALYGETSGEVYVEWFVVRVSEGSLELALATFFRVLAIALPSVVLFVTVDPTDLADGLAQILRLPSRFVLGALAGLRMAGLFLDDWRALELARRARGVADRGRIRRFVGMAFALLVLSIRRGLEARDGDGGAGVRRTRGTHLGARIALRMARVGADGRRARDLAHGGRGGGGRGHVEPDPGSGLRSRPPSLRERRVRLAHRGVVVSPGDRVHVPSLAHRHEAVEVVLPAGSHRRQVDAGIEPLAEREDRRVIRLEQLEPQVPRARLRRRVAREAPWAVALEDLVPLGLDILALGRHEELHVAGAGSPSHRPIHCSSRSESVRSRHASSAEPASLRVMVTCGTPSMRRTVPWIVGSVIAPPSQWVKEDTRPSVGMGDSRRSR